MAGIAILLDLCRKNPSFFSGQALHSYGSFSATAAVSAAAASVAAATPFASRALFGNAGISIAKCDAGATWSEDYISKLRSASSNIFENDSLKYSTKEYHIEMKPLFSAFGAKSLAMTSLRSFLMFYLPLLEPHTNMEDDDEDFLQETAEKRHVDLVVPFQKSVKQIVRETTVVTTRRVLERLAVTYFSQRMAWKLLKDVPKSAVRKADRGMPTSVYFIRVSRTTFRGHFLGVAASWLVQVGIEIYRFFSTMFNSEEEIDKADNADNAERVKLLGKKVTGTTIKCGASLVFASIGAGIGATISRPSVGQWIGCAAGDFAGPIIVAVCFEKFFHVDL